MLIYKCNEAFTGYGYPCEVFDNSVKAFFQYLGDKPWQHSKARARNNA